MDTNTGKRGGKCFYIEYRESECADGKVFGVPTEFDNVTLLMYDFTRTIAHTTFFRVKTQAQANSRLKLKNDGVSNGVEAARSVANIHAIMDGTLQCEEFELSELQINSGLHLWYDNWFLKGIKTEEEYKHWDPLTDVMFGEINDVEAEKILLSHNYKFGVFLLRNLKKSNQTVSFKMSLCMGPRIQKMREKKGWLFTTTL